MEGGVTDYKGRNNLIAVKYYLQHGTFPKDCKKEEKRSVRKRSQTFKFMNNKLYYTGGRHNSKRPILNNGLEEPPENNDDADNSQALRECCTTEEERQAAVMRCHIADDGNHFGIEKTTERVSRVYYWVGIIGTVKKVLHNCDFCVARGIRCTTGILSNPMVNVSVSAASAPVSAPAISTPEEADPATAEPATSESTDDCVNAVKTESEVQISQVELREDPDVFCIAQETCSYFWQRVEIQVFGPFQAGRKQVYVAVALDCYSQFPEAAIIDQISSSSLTSFVLNLICRYGVMEKLCMLQNKTTKNVYLYINMRDLEVADISPTYLTQHANPADERWQRVSHHLEQFVESYPKIWDRRLEAFMVPLRISLPPQADYTPAYLTFNREPMLPEKLSHKSDAFGNSEVRMSDAEEKQTVDLLVAAYGKEPQTPTPNFEIDICMLPSVKLEPLTMHEQDVLNLEESTIVPVTFEEEMKAGAPTKEEVAAVVEDLNEAYGASTDDEVTGHFDEASDLDDDGDESYRPGGSCYGKSASGSTRTTRSSNRKRVPTFKAKEGLRVKKAKRKASPPPPPAQPPPPKRKRGRPPKVKPVPPQEQDKEDLADTSCEQTDQTSDEFSHTSLLPPKGSSKPALTSSGLFNSLEQLDLDLYYLVIKCYKDRMAYPPRVSVDFKRAVRRLAETVVFKDGKLYGHQGKSEGRRIVTKERERFSLLRKAHTKGEEHLGRLRVQKAFRDMNVYWKGIVHDIDGFIHSCPECGNNPVRSKTIVKIPSKSKTVKQKEHDGDPHISEDEEEESSYEDLIQYLTDTTFSPTTTTQQQQRIQQRSASFCIINGSLYYKSPARPKSQPRQVLFSEKTRQEAVVEAHIEDGRHLSQQDTQVKLRRQYFWSGMTYDVIRHVSGCCMSKLLSSSPYEHRDPAVQRRVVRFRTFYKEGIPDLYSETEALGGPLPEELTNSDETETKDQGDTENQNGSASATSEADASKEGENSVPAPSTELLNTKEDKILRTAIEAIIINLGGEKSEPPKPRVVKKKKIPLSATTKELTVAQLRVLKGKNKHRCEHCGRVVKGDVAFKVHLYKHTGVKPFSCTVCGKSFSNRKSQRIHMRKHTGVKPYLCNQCGREFFRSASLRYHLRAHITGKGAPVTCDICGRSFSTQHRLARHKEFKHPAQAKVYICNQCGKNFTAARSLKRHEQTHSGYRRYQCQYCTKSFYRKEYLNAHLTNHAEYEPEIEKLKKSKKTVKKPLPQADAFTVVIPGPSGDNIPSNIIHWTESEQSTRRLDEPSVTDLDTYQRHAVTIQPSLPSSHATSSHVSHLPSGSITAHSHTVHHQLHHPIAHAARVMNVTGPNGPVSLALAARQQIEVVHAGQEILLQHDAVPVQYEVECLSGEPANFSEADLNAIHLLAQASISGPNLQSI